MKTHSDVSADGQIEVLQSQDVLVSAAIEGSIYSCLISFGFTVCHYRLSIQIASLPTLASANPYVYPSMWRDMGGKKLWLQIRMLLPLDDVIDSHHGFCYFKKSCKNKNSFWCPIET